MLIAYKYRLYPTEEQKQFLAKTMGCARFVYNWALAIRKADYEKQEAEGVVKPKTLSIYEISRQLTQFKKKEEYSWLSEVSSSSLIWALTNLDTAYKNFFRRIKKGGEPAGFPKFKNKSGTQSFQFHQAYSVDFEKQTVSIPKMENIPVVFHRVFEGKMKTATISREPSGRHYISILVETANSLPDIPVDISTIIGIDHGIRNFITLSNGKTWENLRVEEKAAKRLARQARNLSKKKLGSNNYKKQRVKKAVLEAHVADKREGYIHQVTSEIIEHLKEKNILSLAIRDYDIKKMVKKIEPKKTDDAAKKYEKNGRSLQKKLNRKIKDVAWGKFISVLSYKCLKNGIRFVEVESPYTSTTCSHCGHNSKDNVNKDLFHCLACGHREHSDLNAAKNTAQLGMAKLQDLVV